MALHVNRKVCKIYNAISVFLFCSFSLSLLPLSPLPTSTPLYVLMLHVKAPAALAHHFEFLLIGSLKIYLATSGIRASDLQTSIMPSETRSQDLKKLEDSFEVANKEQSARHAQVLTQLETYGQLLHATKATQDNKIEELKELISGIAYQQSTLLQRMQTSTLERSPMKNHQDLPHGGFYFERGLLWRRRVTLLQGT